VGRPPVYTPLTIEQGTTWQCRWPVADPTTGEPVDLTGWSARGQVRKWAGAEPVLHEWSVDADNLTLGVDGYLSITVDPAESSTWDWCDGRYDIELTDPNGTRVIRIAAGPVTVSPEITR
jgi:hypothetical protein